MDESNIRFEENKLILEEKVVPFKYTIGQILVAKLRIFVLLNIPDDVDEHCNIYALTKTGKIVWQVQPVEKFNPQITNFSPFVGMTLLPNGDVSASNYFGLNYEIASDNGYILSSKMVR